MRLIEIGRILATSCGLTILFSPLLMAEPTDLTAYLDAMDHAEVTFDGTIRFDASEREFHLYDQQDNRFGATIDAGREIRERIEEECVSSMFYRREELCMIVGAGSVEIRGSSINISIEQVTSLTK